MNTTEYGVSSWDENVSAGAGRGRENREPLEKIEWLRLEKGMNQLRIVTKPVKFLAHKYKSDDDKGFGDWVKCSMPLPEKTCPLCDAQERVQGRWLIGVIDRKTNSYKVLEIGKAVYEEIQTLNRTPMYADPTRYDIILNVNPKGGATGYYKVMPLPAEPLSEQDQKIKSSVNMERLVKQATPPTAEQVMKRINALRQKKGLPALESIPTSNKALSKGNKFAAKAPQKAEPPKVDMSGQDEDLEDFPDADG